MMEAVTPFSATRAMVRADPALRAALVDRQRRRRLGRPILRPRQERAAGELFTPTEDGKQDGARDR